MCGGNNNWLKFEPSSWSKGRQIAFRLVVTMLIAAITNILFSATLDTPKMSSIRRDNKRLEQRFEILQGKVASAERTLADIRHRDQYVYRPLLGVDTLNIPADISLLKK